MSHLAVVGPNGGNVIRETGLTGLTEHTATARECSVRVISDYASLLALEPVWNALVEEAQIDHPFLRHEWVRTWWECFGDGHELHVLEVKAGAQTVAIAPLMLSRVRIHGIPIRRVEFIANVHTPRCDLIVAGRHAEAYRAIWDYLHHTAGRWDVLELCQVPAGSRTLDALRQLAAEDGCAVGLWRSADSPYVPFTGSWDRYVHGLSRNHRAKVRKGLNRLTRSGRTDLEVVSAEEDLDGALDDGLRIEAAAWKGKAGTAICSQANIERFYRSLARRTLRFGALRLLFLSVERTRIAFAYALEYRNKLYVLKAGYHPGYARYSPYNLLCYLVFQDGFERGLAEYEFLGGDEDWKLDWTKERKVHYWLYVFQHGLRPRLLYYAKFRLAPALRRQRFILLVRDTIEGRRTDRAHSGRTPENGGG